MDDKRRAIALLIFATIAGMSLWFMTAAILPEITAEAGLTRGQASLLSSAVQAGFVFGALSISISGITDRLDPRRVFLACTLGTVVANSALLVVPLGSVAAVALRFATGAFMAGVYPVAMKIAVGWGVKDRGLLVGIIVGALTFGNSLPYGLSWLGGADWRAVLGTSSAVAAIGGFCVLGAGLGPHHARATVFHPRAIFLAWSTPGIRYAYLGYFGHMWELFVVWAWTGSAAAASYAATMDPAAASSLGTLTAFLTIAAGAPACVVAGRYADRIGKARVALIAMLASATCAVLTALSFGGPAAVTLPLFILWGATVVPDSAQFSALVADFSPPEFTGSLLTFQTALGFLLTVLTVQVAPLISEAWGWPALLAALAVGPLLGALAMRTILHLRPDHAHGL